MSHSKNRRNFLKLGGAAAIGASFNSIAQALCDDDPQVQRNIGQYLVSNIKGEKIDNSIQGLVGAVRVQG